jgi:hypothetical protein
LVQDVDEDEHAAGKTDGQAGDVDEGEEFVAEEVPPGGDEKVSEHSKGLMGREEQRICGNGEGRWVRRIWMRDFLICSVLEEGVFGNGRRRYRIVEIANSSVSHDPIALFLVMLQMPKQTGYSINIEIDKLTNSIVNTISGDSFETEVLPVSL